MVVKKVLRPIWPTTNRRELLCLKRKLKNMCPYRKKRPRFFAPTAEPFLWIATASAGRNIKGLKLTGAVHNTPNPFIFVLIMFITFAINARNVVRSR